MTKQVGWRSRYNTYRHIGHDPITSALHATPDWVYLLVATAVAAWFFAVTR